MSSIHAELEKRSIAHSWLDTALGTIMMGATKRGICFLQFGESTGDLLLSLSREYPSAEIIGRTSTQNRQLDRWRKGLEKYLNGGSPLPEHPLDLHGTPFQIKVWKYLQSISPGRTKTYSEVAVGIGHATAVRAVAGACARNRIAILIPCHRVIREDGRLAGFRWGMNRKQALLDLEKTFSDRFANQKKMSGA